MESNSYNILWWFIIVALVAGIGFTIWWLVKRNRTSSGDGSKDNGDGSPSNWSTEQTENAKSQMGDAMPSSIKNCAVKGYSMGHSYTDFQNKVDFQTEMPKIFQKCLGSKGKWDSDLKTSLVNTLGQKLGTSCSKCVIDMMEGMYDPMQFLVLLEKMTIFEQTNPDVEWSNPPSDTPQDILIFVKNMGMVSIKCGCVDKK